MELGRTRGRALTAIEKRDKFASYVIEASRDLRRAMVAARRKQNGVDVTMRLEIEWTRIDGHYDPKWDEDLCLYAYTGPAAPYVYYIGKANYCIIRTWKHWAHKRNVFSRISSITNLEKEDLTVLCGRIPPREGKRRSDRLLNKLESLLIYRLQPCGNTVHRYSRKIFHAGGMTVVCTGDWPLDRDAFRDPGSALTKVARKRTRATRDPVENAWSMFQVLVPVLRRLVG